MIADPCPLSPEEARVVAANDEPVAIVVIAASGWVCSEYVCALDTTAGLAWLERRIEQARRNLGAPECRVPSSDPSLVSQGSNS